VTEKHMATYFTVLVDSGKPAYISLKQTSEAKTVIAMKTELDIVYYIRKVIYQLNILI
jgi:hypothetical protein